jgi:hypothetical protein
MAIDEAEETATAEENSDGPEMNGARRHQT